MKLKTLEMVCWFIGFLAFSIYMHETTHVVIYAYYGCDDVTVEWDYPMDIYTMCLEEGYRSSETALLAHSINEVVGYNAIPFLVIIAAVIVTRRDGYGD